MAKRFPMNIRKQKTGETRSKNQKSDKTETGQRQGQGRGEMRCETRCGAGGFGWKGTKEQVGEGKRKQQPAKWYDMPIWSLHVLLQELALTRGLLVSSLHWMSINELNQNLRKRRAHNWIKIYISCLRAVFHLTMSSRRSPSPERRSRSPRGDRGKDHKNTGPSAKVFVYPSLTGNLLLTFVYPLKIEVVVVRVAAVHGPKVATRNGIKVFLMNSSVYFLVCRFLVTFFWFQFPIMHHDHLR